ncbi:MAG TPA: DNA polymerase Y family protein [Roseiarcus sp.]|nr:DNA polymerase Y family protein [Roseiarcus sp.]
MTIRRFLSLWLPRLATDRARRARAVDAAAPLAVVATVGQARRLVGVDANAARLGLAAGLTLADARARHPALVAIEADPEAEARLLERLADWCARFTPLVALDGRDGLMLDVSGVAHLFGGEAALAREIEARFATQGFTLALGLADAPRAAWALARYSRERVAPVGLSGKAFVKLYHEMPVAALGLDDKTNADMARAGLRRVGDLAMRPRAPIAARFGAEAIARLDALSGLTREAISPRFAAPDFCAERRFASPVLTSEAVTATLRRLADDLAALLARHAKGARRLELALFRVDGDVRRIRVGSGRPLGEARAIARLFAERLAGGAEEEIDAGFGVELMRLSCLLAEPLEPSQREWERAHEAERARALADLLDGLSARLGARRVTRQELVEAHIPEQAVVASPAVLGANRARGEGCEPIARAQAPARPLRLFERPEPIEALAEVPDGPPLRFRWRRVLHEVAAIEGPERIAAPWWRRLDAPTRDYFRAEDTAGRRFWLYREGLWGRETTRAKWFLHGVFG